MDAALSSLQVLEAVVESVWPSLPMKESFFTFLLNWAFSVREPG